ncbi:MAG: hypothetical protein O3A42_03600, partial [Actinobacteria bacterium]|nr:hypothetical protein [Actinomycetota bacterium]
MERRTASLRGAAVALGFAVSLATAGSALATTGEESPGPTTATPPAAAVRGPHAANGPQRAARVQRQSPA